jgi:hypothetical protein
VFSTSPLSGLITDDFNHCEGLISPWTFVDPMGDGAYSVTGVGTDDAWLNLAVSAGADHDPYDTRMPARIVQPVNEITNVVRNITEMKILSSAIARIENLLEILTHCDN